MKHLIALAAVWAVAAMTVVVVLGILASGCGSSNEPPPYVPQEPITHVEFTPHGARVNFGSSLKDRPDIRARCLAHITSGISTCGNPSFFARWTFYVFRFPVVFPPRCLPGSTSGVGDSFTSFDRRLIVLSWHWRLESDPAWPGNATEALWYEIENALCGTDLAFVPPNLLTPAQIAAQHDEPPP